MMRLFNRANKAPDQKLGALQLLVDNLLPEAIANNGVLIEEEQHDIRVTCEDTKQFSKLENIFQGCTKVKTEISEVRCRCANQIYRLSFDVNDIEHVLNHLIKRLHHFAAEQVFPTIKIFNNQNAKQPASDDIFAICAKEYKHHLGYTKKHLAETFKFDENFILYIEERTSKDRALYFYCVDNTAETLMNLFQAQLGSSSYKTDTTIKLNNSDAVLMKETSILTIKGQTAKKLLKMLCEETGPKISISQGHFSQPFRSLSEENLTDESDEELESFNRNNFRL